MTSRERRRRRIAGEETHEDLGKEEDCRGRFATVTRCKMPNFTTSRIKLKEGALTLCSGLNEIILVLLTKTL